MATAMELEGKNLGEKHQHLNRLVNDAVTSETYKMDEFNVEEDDVKNLLKIDVANKKRNVDYILKVLVCNDMLYVSRAIKNCQWLVTGDEYRNIINPEYLHNTLFPQMMTKSVTKFTKYIQLNLKDTTRAELFYEYEKSPEKALNWLPHCSPEFILQNFAKHNIEHLKIPLIKRLCEKNIKVLETFVDTYSPISKSNIFEATVFALNPENINQYLDFVEKLQNYEYPKLNKAGTKLVMKLAPKRILDKFENYCNYIHLPTFIKFLKSKNIKTFLMEQATRAEEKNRAAGVFNKHQLQCFFEAMPKEERFNFIKQIFIDKVHTQKDNSLSEPEIKAMSYLYNCIKNKRWYNELYLYQYAPFDVAFTHIKKLIGDEPTNADKKTMFSTLIMAANHNNQNIKLLLQYFQEKRNTVQFEIRYQFVKDIILKENFHKFDLNTWNVLEDIMMTDVDSDHDVQVFLESVIIYKVLHSQCVAEIVEKKFIFNSLTNYRDKLAKEEKLLIFDYLYNHIQTKLNACTEVKTEKQFDVTIKILVSVLNLLNDWDKDLQEFPSIISIIRDLIKAKKQNSWKSDLSILYNKNKSWKKFLFEESFDLCPSQSVLINAVKHDPTMFDRHKSEAEELCLKDKETILQFLRKIKIYWPQSLTKVWTDVFMNKLNNLNNQKASSRGVIILLPRTELLSILNKYAPENPKIDYGNINELNLNLQRCFATNMHIARPQPPPEIILRYAKGDYLKCSFPSLLSIYYNLCGAQSAKYISELLNAQISLQKQAIRFSFIKMKTHEISDLYAKVWKTSKNTTIRSVLFKTVHELLCKEKDPTGIETLWKLLEMFINNLTFNENKNVYDTLLKVSETPIAIRASFFVKSYTFLKSLKDSSKPEYKKYDSSLKYSMFPYAREIIDTLPPTFVENMLLELINDDFVKESGCSYVLRANILVVTSYLLSSKDEETQKKKYEKIFTVIINHCDDSIKENKNRNHCIKNLEVLLDRLYEDVPVYYFEKKNVLPVAMLTVIKDDLERIFPEKENYMMFTKHGLALAFIKSVNGHQGNDWNEVCLAAAPQFGEDCYKILYEHSKKYFPRIYILFANALESVLYLFIQNNLNGSRFKVFECLIQDKDFVLGYLAALQLNANKNYSDDESKEQVEKMRQIISQHPSLEVKMHCYNAVLET